MSSPLSTSTGNESPPPSRDQGGTSGMLSAERDRCSFSVSSLMDLMGTGRQQKAVEDAQKLFQQPPFVADDMQDYEAYDKVFVDSLERTAKAVQIVRDNPKFMLAHSAGKVQMRDLFETNGVASIHFTMFLTFLKTNATKEQQAEWLERATDARYLGAYAQTELGHGSNLRGLETVATFDRETDEFVIHSPTLTSMKFWPTGIYACTHAIVFAKLMLAGKNCGIQAFMLQLRDAEGNLMDGVEVGEIGPKIIGGHVNIGYARFDHVRVPRFNMFAKLFQVTREGELISPPPKVGKIKNISMMMMRVFNVDWAARDTSKAATIAIRYSCVRRQGFRDSTVSTGAGGENVIMDYRMQQLRCFDCLSFSHMLFWNSRYLNDYLSDVQTKINMGDMDAADELPELHATCSGLKVYSTINGHAKMEDCRKACGGQGFLRSSGIADLVCTFAEPCTVEGEQVILSLQVGRFLIKSVRQVHKGETPKGSVKYLLDEALKPRDVPKDLNNQHSFLIAMLRDRARKMAFKLERKFSAKQKDGLTFDEATNACAILSYKTAGCHSAFITARNFFEAIEKYVEEDSIKAALLQLLELQALLQIRNDLADWMGVVEEGFDDQVAARIEALLDGIRPNAVGLADAFGHLDSALKSTLGRYDGNVYEAIYNEAKLSPLNEGRKMAGWDKLKPILDLDFIRKGVGQRHIPSSKL